MVVVTVSKALRVVKGRAGYRKHITAVHIQCADQ